LNEELLRAVLATLPDASTVLQPGNAALDPVYGGRVGDRFGAPAWNYYQVLLDANGRKGGTTCGTALAYWMGKSGFPADMVNRKVDDADAPGGGFMPGSQITKEVSGAQKHGYYLKPDAVGTDWQPGDGYHVDHPPKPNSDHVGVVLAVTPNADGTVAIETGDGGQGTGADIKRNLRVLSADGKTITLNGVAARVLGIIRASDAERLGVDVSAWDVHRGHGP